MKKLRGSWDCQGTRSICSFAEIFGLPASKGGFPCIDAIEAVTATQPARADEGEGRGGFAASCTQGSLRFIDADLQTLRRASWTLAACAYEADGGPTGAEGIEMATPIYGAPGQLLACYTTFLLGAVLLGAREGCDDPPGTASGHPKPAFVMIDTQS